MAYDFDQVIDRRNSDSVKWHYYGDALPLWWRTWSSFLHASNDYLMNRPNVRWQRGSKAMNSVVHSNSIANFGFIRHIEAKRPPIFCHVCEATENHPYGKAQ